MSFFDFAGYGVAVNPNAMRGLSDDEICQMQMAAADAMRNTVSQNYQNAWANIAAWSPPQKPLDERFADFKIRLAEAIERRGSRP